MPDNMTITIQIPRHTWEAIQRYTHELQERARTQGMDDAVFDPHVHAAMMLEQTVDLEIMHRERRAERS
jgi:hypothetical protein